ncbi:glycine-rich protein [Cytobacillus sp. IB215316]|uniref:glycine-rich protein n=1 Tax=Cytobacillus sp. IB215316 TaxID=3097354 RepID=UPI002A1637F5|nr:glycine-rich protein [Cytobacillus sp. IB215316]MDX8360771.1 glycine-rich protein [Cytobacillus sp. IB215316]
MKKFVGIMLVFVLLASSLYPMIIVDSAVVGGGRTVPPGGSAGKDGGIHIPPGPTTGPAAFRVGLVDEEMKDGTEFVENEDDNDSIRNKIKEHYDNHFPNVHSYVMFAYPSAYDVGTKLIGDYIPSSGNLVTTPRDYPYYDYTIRRIETNNQNSQNVFYSRLAAEIPTSADFDNLANGKWKEKIIPSADDRVKSKNTWNWILQEARGIEERIKDYTEDINIDNDIEGERHRAVLKYIDLIMTVWALASPEDKPFFEQSLDRFFGERDTLLERPLLLSIDTVSRFSSISALGSGNYMFIPDTKFLMFAHSATPKGDITSPDFAATNGALKDTVKLLMDSANISIKEAPNRKRTTSKRGNALLSDAFAFGYSGVLGDNIHTETGVAVEKSNSLPGLMTTLHFQDNQFGFLIQGGPQNTGGGPPPVCECETNIVISNKDQLKDVVVETEKINQIVSLNVDMTMKDESKLNNWSLLLDGATNLQMKMDITRESGSPSPQLTPINTGLTPGQWISVDEGALISSLTEGVKMYQDNLSNFPIAEDSSVKLTYNAILTIKGINRLGEPFEYECEVGTEQPIIFTRPQEPEPEIGYYQSAPSYWSELKQGSPENETFEAMAGTPTTRDLYFASGGSEFIVDIEVEYVSNATSTRTYKYIFNKVVNGWAMDPDPGSRQKDTPPPKPEPRKREDSGGNIYIEKVVLEEGEYEKEPEVPCSGDPCTGGKPAVMGTEYWWVREGYPSTMVGGHTDEWTQTVTYDYMKINKVKVWKLVESKIDGMKELTATDEFTAQIEQGTPNIFGNIADENTSKEHRLRYSFETDQHDLVIWEEDSDNINPDDNSRYSGTVNEQEKFDEARNMTTNVTAISDFLILQTSQGDQSVMYFEKKSDTRKTTENLTVPTSSFEMMWTNNPNSAAKWEKDHITVGSYNGNYSNPSQKYSTYSNRKVSTIFDTMPADLARPSRPSQAMRLEETGIDIPDTKRNGEYIVGNASVFYQYDNNFEKGTTTLPYDTGYNGRYSKAGHEFISAYSDSHNKVNDIVVHNPVSTEDAIVKPLDDSRDQRTNDSKLIGGNLQEPASEYEKVLKEGYVFTPTEPTYEEQTIRNLDYIPEFPGVSETYNYTGNYQTFTAPASATYTLEVWGAQGGTSGGGRHGALGGYAKGTISLEADETIRVYVGGQGGRRYGGWNGGGNVGGDDNGESGGGGATDIRTSSSLNSRIIVAGGGGGVDTNDGDGGVGGGETGGHGKSTSGSSSSSSAGGGTQTRGGNGSWDGRLGQGASSSSSDGGGGGGGYYGGGTSTGHGGGGGSGYIGGVLDGDMDSGVNSGNGKAKITSPSTPAQGEEYITVSVMTDPGQLEPPESAYEYVLVSEDPEAPVMAPDEDGNLTPFTPGNFINIDYKFDIYFPNKGDFEGNNAHGISKTSSIRGMGYTNGMDTTEWTDSKQVKFDFDVIYVIRDENNQDNILSRTLHSAGQWIDLKVEQEMYEFYVPLSNREAMSALVEFKAIANNGSYLDNDMPTNRTRNSRKAAKHSAIKKWNIDVVGRIGNMVIEDTGDFRFSNLFKQPLNPTEWLVPNVVKNVDLSMQNRVYGDLTNIRGDIVGVDTDFLNTYGTLPFLEIQEPIGFPLTPADNNIAALKNQPMRIGYNVFADIQTIGNYHDNMQIVPYYFHLDLTPTTETGVINPTVTPVDVYMDVNSYYKPINIFGFPYDSEYSTDKYYQFIYNLDWDNESVRRNYEEGALTERVVDMFTVVNSDGTKDEDSILRVPFGSQYPFGTAQILHLKDRNRTFIGSSQTYGVNNNPGGKIFEENFALQAQRWHFTYGLPSSAVIVEHDGGNTLSNITQSNIDTLMNNRSVILMAADIKAVGDTYALQYDIMSDTVEIAGREYDLSGVMNEKGERLPVISVYSAHRSSAHDLEISGTH